MSVNKKILHVQNYSTDMLDRSKNKDLVPIIISGGIDNWRAMTSWNPNFFREKYGDISVETNHDLPVDSSPYLYEEESRHTRIMKLGNFIKLMPNSTSCYVAQSDISLMEGIEQDYDFYNLIPENDHDKKINTNLWLGFNTRSGLHFDYNDNFLAQIYGTKKVFLAPPENTKYLYPLSDNFSKTQVNPMDPDFKKFPKLKLATIYEGKINAGDVLFIPKGWYHYIYSPKDSISLNCWYGKPIGLLVMTMFLYRSGVLSWLNFLQNFIWNGLLKQPFKGKLYCSDTMGQRAYKFLLKKLNL